MNGQQQQLSGQQINGWAKNNAKQFHAPLRRVLPREVASPENAAQQHLQEHPLLFSSSTSAQSVQPKSASMAPNPASSHCSLADSCYSSCSEGEHLALSRETSDSSSASASSAVAGALAEEFGHKLAIGQAWDGPGQAKLEPSLLDFVTRLGFSEDQLRAVLGQLQGEAAHQDRVLSELIKQAQKGATGQQRPWNVRNWPRGQKEPPKLRPIVLDGSNIAMTHGNNSVFSCRGIRECVDFFSARGHADILVFVPQFRREQPRPEAPVVDQHILMELEAERRLVWTPSRRVGGRRIVCHDDRYILKTAAEKQAVIVSNDEYRELAKENARWRTVVDNHLLMYTFVDGKFMPPDDPLGRHGPKLEQFLSFAHIPPNAQLCPYAKKCTYGNKCKYFHPERPNGIWMGAADRLVAGLIQTEPGEQLGKRQSLAPRPSLHAEGCHSQGGRANVGRTQSLNFAQPSLDFSGLSCEQSKPVHVHQQQHFHGHAPVLRIESSPEPLFAAREQQLHFPLGRMPSAPAPPHSSPHFRHMFTPSPSIWGDCEFSLTSPSGLATPSPPWPIPPREFGQSAECEQRLRLQYHLSQLFPESAVLAVMGAHPKETDAQRLCQRIIAFQKGLQQNEGEKEEEGGGEGHHGLG